MFKSITLRGTVTGVLSGALFLGCFAPIAVYASGENNPKTEAISEEISFMPEPEQFDEEVAELVSMFDKHLAAYASGENNPKTEAISEEISFMPEPEQFDEEVAELVSMFDKHLTACASGAVSEGTPEPEQSDEYKNLREKVTELVSMIDNQPLKKRDKWLFMKTLQDAIEWANVDIPELTQFVEHNALLDEKEDEPATLFASFYPNKQVVESYESKRQIDPT